MQENKDKKDGVKKVELPTSDKDKETIKDVLIEEQSRVIREVQGDINSENRD